MERLLEEALFLSVLGRKFDRPGIDVITGIDRTDKIRQGNKNKVTRSYEQRGSLLGAMFATRGSWPYY